MPGPLATLLLPPCPPARFVMLGAGLLATPPAVPTLVVAPLAGEALLLGRHQRLAGALERKNLGEREVLRRNSGGRTLAVGPGTVGVLLALPDMGALLEAPLAPSKVLNRYVRGLLAGLSRAGAPGGAHYFGRDFVSAQSKQLAVIGQDNGPRAALFEAFVAVEQPLALPAGLNGYPEHGDPRAAGPEHATLSGLRGAPIGIDALAEALFAGYAETYRAERQAAPSNLPEAELAPAHEDESGWLSSGVADIPIGFLEALLQKDGDRVAAARLRGDFLAPEFVIRQLERDLAGLPLQFEQLGARVDAAFHQPGAFLFGTLELRLFADALLAAAAS